MNTTQSTFIDELYFYFVVKQDLPDGKYELSLSSYAPFRDDRTTFPFDTETDAALYLLDEYTRGAIVSSNDVETAKAIIRGEQPIFVYEEKQPDGTLLLSLHDFCHPKMQRSRSSAADQQKCSLAFFCAGSMRAHTFKQPKKR